MRKWNYHFSLLSDSSSTYLIATPGTISELLTHFNDDKERLGYFEGKNRLLDENFTLVLIEKNPCWAAWNLLIRYIWCTFNTIHSISILFIWYNSSFHFYQLVWLSDVEDRKKVGFHVLLDWIILPFNYRATYFYYEHCSN